MRILFMGTPDFAAVSLKRLVEDGHELCGVFTQPDKPRNRNKVTFSPVKEYALSHGLTVYQPTKLRDGTALELVKSLAPELIVVVAYGRILPKDILDVPPLGCVNVHASLLPKYRGSAPINWAMLNGDTETGPRTPQDSTQVTFAPMLSRELSPIDWTKPVAAIRNQVRGLIPWPCATAELAGQRFKIYKTAVGTATDKTPGTLLSAGKKGIEVACGDGQSLWITELQAEGGKRMSAAAYLLGHPMNI